VTGILTEIFYLDGKINGYKKEFNYTANCWDLTSICYYNNNIKNLHELTRRERLEFDLSVI